MAAVVPSITDMALLVLLPTMGVQFIVTVESLATKATFRMPFESGLIDGSGVVISKLFVLSKFPGCEQLMFVGEHFLVAGAKITHDLAVLGLDMSM